MAMNVKNIMNSVNDAVRDNNKVAAAKKVQEVAEERTTLMIRMKNYESLESDFWANSGIPDIARGSVRDAYAVLLAKNSEKLTEAITLFMGV